MMDKWQVTFYDKVGDKYTTVRVYADDCKEAMQTACAVYSLQYTSIVSIICVSQ